MKSWPTPSVPSVPGTATELKLYDSADDEIKPVQVKGDTASMYVCGITPYDSTHLGHAATYVTFDVIYRMLLDQGLQVHYVQNVTDVDDPLFERAARDGVDWRELGESQVNLFRSDMEQLSVLPPQDYIGAIESIDEVIGLTQKLLDNGAAYVVEDAEYPDVYASIDATKHFGYESNYDRATMEKFFAERGGDPDRVGKKDPLDALLWRAARDGEPSWESPFGPGRPGWHVECSAIATNRLGSNFLIQGGGSDLKYPHHEYSAAHAEAGLGVDRMAEFYVHAGMIGLEGTKMSKSLGNLVFVHKLVEQGIDPSAIRLGLYVHHYRSNRDWSDEVLKGGVERLNTWRKAIAHALSSADTDAQIDVNLAKTAADRAVHNLRERLADDLDTAGALQAIDEWAKQPTTAEAAEIVAHAVKGLLGVRIS